MYAPFFGLQHEPFSIAPDPRYLFMSERHREALAHLLYGVRSGGGFVLLTGEIGAGKTTVCRCFLEQIPKRCNVAYIFNPKLTVEELLSTVCEEFRIPAEHPGPGRPTVKDHVDALNAFLLRTHAVGQNNVLIIDEAQNLSPEVLEQLRLLTNLETNERKLLQIVLIGQPELRSMLAGPQLEQLAQRVIARYHLGALSAAETDEYIRHRLGVAGLQRAIPFDRRAMKEIHRLARGIPRRINLLCDRAMLGAYAKGQSGVDLKTVRQAAAEVFDPSPPSAPSGWHVGPAAAGARRSPALALAIGGAVGAGLFALAALSIDGPWRRPAVAVASAQATPPAARTAASGAGRSSSAPASAATASSAPLATMAGASAAANSPVQPAAPAASAISEAGLMPSEADAWRQLGSAWGVRLGEGDPCTAAQRQRLQCFRSAAGSLALLRQLDRPAILRLRLPGGQPAYAVLNSLGEDRAVLQGAEGARMASQTVSLAALAGLWQGEFATFWRAPEGYGAAGEPRAWLEEKLPPAAAAASGAQELPARVSAFQLAQGLKPDGKAGPITLMQLNRLAGVAEPRLAAAR